MDCIFFDFIGQWGNFSIILMLATSINWSFDNVSTTNLSENTGEVTLKCCLKYLLKATNEIHLNLNLFHCPISYRAVVGILLRRGSLGLPPLDTLLYGDSRAEYCFECRDTLEIRISSFPSQYPTKRNKKEIC